jgi:hypothetical protein
LSSFFFPFFPFPYPFFPFPYPFSLFWGAWWRVDWLSLLPWGDGMLQSNFVVFGMGVSDSRGKFFFWGLFGGLLIQKLCVCNVLGVVATFKLGVASSKIDLRVLIWGSLGVAHSKTDPRVTIWGLLISLFLLTKGGSLIQKLTRM